ncbi:MAG: glyoxalase [Acidimicrobiales bacterium mtb01]|nr:VOC family protein [Actinomycetota bacterium]TEX47443.1 MAG: glyoxalase [Acidimicrobiales bacterium mtb01]
MASPLAVVFDCHEPRRLAAFWRELVGGGIEPATEGDDWVGLRDVPVFGHLGFQKVPEGKAVKNRVHVDLDVADIAIAVDSSRALGASVVGDVVEEPTNWFQVMRDPEGNEFCFILRKSRLVL